MITIDFERGIYYFGRSRDGEGKTYGILYLREKQPLALQMELIAASYLGRPLLLDRCLPYNKGRSCCCCGKLPVQEKVNENIRFSLALRSVIFPNRGAWS